MQLFRYILLCIAFFSWLYNPVCGQQPAGAVKDSVKMLDSITVTARKPLVVRKADRYVVQVENSFLANGLSGLDVLQKSPGVWVSADGAIRLTGSLPVTVMINDIVQRMSGAELAEYLKTLRSEDISKIEVITSPPAEFEAAAAGGIVHIILKKARRQGISGALYTQYKQQGKLPYATAGGMLDYKQGALYLFGSYGYSKDKSRYKGHSSTNYPDNSHLQSAGYRYNNNTRRQYRFGMVYDIAAMHTLTLQHNASKSLLDQEFYSDITFQSATASLLVGYAATNWYRKPTFSSTAASYAWLTDTMGSSLKLIADYSRSSKQEINQLTSVYNDTAASSNRRTITPGYTNLYSVQLDYVQAITGKAQVKTGWKYVHTSRHNTLLAEEEEGGSWVKNAAGSNDFVYREDLLMFYAAAEKQWKAIAVKAGVRGEQTTAAGTSLTTAAVIRRRYFGWFPSLFISHQLNEAKGHSVQLSYSRTVRRPAYNDLNPYRLQLSDYAVLAGNPQLQPQYTHGMRAGLLWRRAYMAELYVNLTTNFIAQTARTVDDKVIEHMSKNYPRNTEWGIAVSVPVTIAKGWHSNNNLLLYRAMSNLNEVVIRRTSASLKSIHTIEWKKVADIDAYLEYHSPYTNANGRMAAYFDSEMGIARSILKQRLRVRVYVTDVFNTFREKEVTVYNNTTVQFYQKRPTRTGGVSVTWRFSAGKVFTRKKIDANNTDEKSRMGN